MSAAQHTPGPWSVESDLNTFVIRGAPVMQTAAREITYEFCDYVATTWGTQTKQNEVNARLIAAAPVLLKELQELVEAYEDGEPNWKQIVSSAHAAIAKATGEQA